MEARRQAFEDAYRKLQQRIAAFVNLPLESLSTAEVAAAARRIHEESEA
jgi:arsenate reductase